VSISPYTQAQIAALLGREPRGLEAVAVADVEDQPMVIRVASLVEGKPFPNLFWLVDRALVYKIDCEEASGLIGRFQDRVDSDSNLQKKMRLDHQAHIELRNSFIDDATRVQLNRLEFWQVLQRRGIGGIADFGRIRCLHTWYASHLVVTNTVGAMLDQHWAV
jgi:uncharacterized protein